MRKPLVSVIVPVYKTEQYIHECIDSIINQTYSNLEIILIDDGSPDKCPEICDEYAKRDNRVVVLHQNNSGQAVARNAALDIMNGEYVAFVDSDDMIDLNTINYAVCNLENKNLSVIYFEAMVIDENGRPIGTDFHVYDDFTIRSSQEVFSMVITDRIGGQPCKAVYRKQCWQNVRFPEGRIYEDLAATFRVFENAMLPVGFSQEKLYRYRRNPNSTCLEKGREKKRAYHIFLAFLDQYRYARNLCDSEIADRCLANVAKAARGVVLLCNTTDKSYREAYSFLKEKHKEITKCEYLSFIEKQKNRLVYTWPAGIKLLRNASCRGRR